MIAETLSILALTVVIGFLVIWILRSKNNEEIVPPLPRQRVNNRMNPAADDEDSDEENNEPQQLNKKDAAKQAKKEEKKKMQAARRAALEEQNKFKEDKHQQWLRREAILEEKEREEEERLKRIEEERQKKEEEEYNQWKTELVVEGAGEEDQEESFTLEKFLNYIKMRKVVMIEDIASSFLMDGKTVVKRIEELENEGFLTGILDDRGKYIYITNDEFFAVKKYIEARGRVSRIELANESGRLIRLVPTNEDKAKIEEEEKLIVEKEVS
jgi:flagellar motor protein MotB